MSSASVSLDKRDLIVKLAIQHHLPSICATLAFVSAGALISYGSVRLADYRRSAGYVDRILRGERPADLPVQALTKYQLIINAKTAKAIGLTLPPSLLARADEVIEHSDDDASLREVYLRHRGAEQASEAPAQ
jgi:putative tryptophan/tyrosine transport system substrate-binding protein